LVTIATQESESPEEMKNSYWSSLDLLSVAGIMLTIGIVWRVVDQFVLGLGSTWMNIMPSKLFPFLIMIGFFLKYRRTEIGSVLGLSRKQLRAQIVTGLLMVFFISILIDVGGTVIYATFLNPSYPLQLHILNLDLLGYTFFFFLVNAFLEESLFRGLIQNSIKTRLSANRAIFISAILFGAWHAGWPLVNGLTGTDALVQVSSMVFFTTILGLLFGVYYEHFSSAQSLVGPIIAHTFFNFISESFKVGPEPVIQGPDLIFSSPGLMIISLLLFLGVFVFLFGIFWRYKIEDIAELWNRMKYGLISPLRGLHRKVPMKQNDQIEVF